MHCLLYTLPCTAWGPVLPLITIQCMLTPRNSPEYVLHLTSIMIQCGFIYSPFGVTRCCVPMFPSGHQSHSLQKWCVWLSGTVCPRLTSWGWFCQWVWHSPPGGRGGGRGQRKNSVTHTHPHQTHNNPQFQYRKTLHKLRHQANPAINLWLIAGRTWLPTWPSRRAHALLITIIPEPVFV